MKISFLSIVFFFSFIQANAQRVAFDTTHSPKKAVILSAVLPGAGQAYNRKFWKMPIIYAGLGTCIYFLINNNKQYHLYHDEYLYRINNAGAVQNEETARYSEGNLLTIIDQYQRWRDLSVISLAAVYTLQLVDAAVDGYLWRFDTSDDLSFRFRPSLISSPYSVVPALKIRIKF